MKRIGRFEHRTIEDHFTAVAFQRAGKNFHQRGLAGTVLANKRMHLATLDVNIYAFQCMHAAEGFLQVFEAKHFRSHAPALAVFFCSSACSTSITRMMAPTKML